MKVGRIQNLESKDEKLSFFGATRLQIQVEASSNTKESGSSDSSLA